LLEKDPNIGPATQKDSQVDPLGPKALRMDPKGISRQPKALQGTVKQCSKHLKGSQRETKVTTKASEGIPGVPQDGQRKGALAGPTI